MADFCKVYHKYLFGDVEASVNDGIDLTKEARGLKYGCSKQFLCEGCGKFFAVLKTEKGKIVAVKVKDETFDWDDAVSIQDFYEECRNFIANESDRSLYTDFLDEENI